MLMISTYTAFELISQLGVGILFRFTFCSRLWRSNLFVGDSPNSPWFIYCLYILHSISKKHTILSLDSLIHTSKEKINYFRIIVHNFQSSKNPSNYLYKNSSFVPFLPCMFSFPSTNHPPNKKTLTDYSSE